MVSNLILFALTKFISVFIKVIKGIMVIKSTKMLASITSAINSVVGVMLVKIVVEVDVIPACIIACVVNFLANYSAMFIYEHKIQKKDVVKDLNSRIMNIDEAIKHCDNVSNEHKCDACGQDHAQLSMWLKELKRLKSRRSTMVV